MLFNFVLFAIRSFYWLLKVTASIEAVGIDSLKNEVTEGKTPVLASAHTAMLGAILSYPLERVTILVSRSKDGELISNILSKWGYQTVRGSSNRGGPESLARLVDAVKENEPVAIAFDGPKGPPLVPKFGVAVCAEAATGSLYFLKVELKNNFLLRRPLAIRLGSWDKFSLLLPFCSFRVTYEKIEVALPKSDPNWRAAVVEKLAEHARAAYGHLYSNLK